MTTPKQDELPARIRELEKDNKAFLKWAQTFEAERDAALAAIERVRELAEVYDEHIQADIFCALDGDTP
jgi:hypothetical protein